MRELKPVIRYKCEFCNRRPYLNKQACLRHEDVCYKNPDRNCPICKNEGLIDEVLNNGYMGHKNLGCPMCNIAEKVGGKSYVPVLQIND